jgi:small subunit ribosomal protein S17
MDKSKTVENNGKEFTGRVTSVKMNHSAVVSVTHMRAHPLYHKTMKITKKFTVQNDMTDLKVGDDVKISETKPISKTKYFKIIEKLK